MSASSASVGPASPSIRTLPRDPLGAQLLTAGVIVALATLIALHWQDVAATVMSEWPGLVFWGTLTFVVNLFPIAVGERRFALDDPTLLAVCFLYPPPVAALVAAIAVLDLREIRGEVRASRALLNRCQIALSVYAAGWVFGLVAGELEPWYRAIPGTLLALGVNYVCNVTLVSLYVSFNRREAFGKVLRTLTVGSTWEFLGTYAGYGAFALILSRLFVEVGAWTVVGFLIPILVARQMLARGHELQQLTKKLQRGERLLERLVERSVDERRDERLRIADDLHDDLLQSLVRMWFVAKISEQRLRAGDDGIDEVTELGRSCEEAMGSVRNVIHDLKESPLGRGGLVPTLRGLARDLQLDWKIRIDFDSPEEVDLSPEAQVIAYQVVREALRNALKHAQASRLCVRLVQFPDRVELSVEDDGLGFDPETADRDGHFGLGMMKERMRKVGGALRIDAQRELGTRLTAIIPRQPRP